MTDRKINKLESFILGLAVGALTMLIILTYR
jgi:hypothetical protein